MVNRHSAPNGGSPTAGPSRPEPTGPNGNPASSLSTGRTNGHAPPSWTRVPVSEAVPTEANARRVRVLLVDDVPPLRALVRTILERTSRFVVVGEAGDGVEAVEQARRHRPDLVLLDLQMPRMGGLEALPQLRAVAPAARIVILTGSAVDGVRERARELGASGFLEKGLPPEELVENLSAALAGSGWIPAGSP